MGGLLAADAATDPSNSPDGHPGGRPRRIVGVIAFDTPYLGMHPHVVVSGIASLLPKGDEEEKKKKSESTMNDHPQVNVVDEQVTDDWEAFKKQAHVRPRNAPYPSSSSSSSFVSSHGSADISALSLTGTSQPPTPPAQTPFVDRALNFIAARNDDPLVRWLHKHADDPFSSAKRWVVEHFQFGICMFDPAGLKARYTRLVQWEQEGGLWINYWTKTVSLSHTGGSHVAEQAVAIDNDEALVANGMLESPPPYEPPVASSSSQPDTKVAQKEADKKVKEQAKQVKREEKAKAKALKQEEKSKKPKPERHFVVLPNGLGEFLGGFDKWENIPIAGVQDEVNAHTGLFIPQHNLDYERLVEKVADKVLSWCERIPKAQPGH